MFDKWVVRLLLLCGRFFSPLYSAAMRIRGALYSTGIFATTRLPLPVVSVGNLTLGGTGKTPMVIYLARLLARHGVRVGIVSRGYGGQNRQPVALVSDGQRVLLAPAEAGDEPVLLARELPGVPVLISRARANGGRYLAQQGFAGTVILDDGFQHLALARDLDLVLFASGVPVWRDWVFPGGMLREPPSALRRADCCVITGACGRDAEDDVPLRRWLGRHCPGLPVFMGQYLPVALYDQAQRRVALSELAGVPLFAFCGIANPQAFQRTLAGRFLIKGWEIFADHHPFSDADMEVLVRRAAAAGCAALITTEKDYVKVQSLRFSLPIWVLAVELRLEEGFDRFVLKKLQVDLAT